jgi:hypothetical protein
MCVTYADCKSIISYSHPDAGQHWYRCTTKGHSEQLERQVIKHECSSLWLCTWQVRSCISRIWLEVKVLSTCREVFNHCWYSSTWCQRLCYCAMWSWQQNLHHLGAAKALSCFPEVHHVCTIHVQKSMCRKCSGWSLKKGGWTSKSSSKQKQLSLQSLE